MTKKKDTPRASADILESERQQAASADGTPRTSKRLPLCAWLSLALPVLGMPLAFILGSLPAIRGNGEFSCFAPAIFAGLAAFPLGCIGVALAVTAIVRREKWVALAVIGLVLNVILVLLSAPLIWETLVI
ncbi:MAG: hypothetical protein NTV22_20045 [bacterium]|nr:hypothetical protein [bacterium]